MKVTIPYKVTFKYQNGKKDESVSVVKDNTVDEPKVDAVKCMKFTGWFTDEACTQAYDFSTPVTGDLTLYGGWDVNHVWNAKYTIDKKATYAAPGSYSIHCSVCNTVKAGSTVTIPKLVVKPTTISKLTAAKKGFTAKWKKGTGVNGYQIQYALNKTFTKSKKLVKVSKATAASKKIGKLKGKKKYFVRIRTYVTENGKTYYSEWSAAKTVKTKK